MEMNELEMEQLSVDLEVDVFASLLLAFNSIV